MSENENFVPLPDDDALDFRTLAEAGLPEWPLLRKAWRSNDILTVDPVYGAKALHETYPDMPEAKKEILLAAVLLSELALYDNGSVDLAKREGEYGPVVIALLQELRDAIPKETIDFPFSKILPVLSGDARRVLLFSALIGSEVADTLGKDIFGRAEWCTRTEKYIQDVCKITESGGPIESLNDPALSARVDATRKSILLQNGVLPAVSAPAPGVK